MDELIKQLLSEIPRYVLNFVRVIASPIHFGLLHDGETEADVGKACVFLGISILVTITIRAPIRHSSLNEPVYLTGYAVWCLAVVLTMSFVIFLSWSLAGGKTSYLRYLIIDSYFFGTFMVLGHMILLLEFALYNVFNPEDDARLWSTIRDAGLALRVVGFALLGFWCLRCWMLFARINYPQSFRRSTLALVIVALVSTPTVFFLILLRAMLIGLVKFPL